MVDYYQRVNKKTVHISILDICMERMDALV